VEKRALACDIFSRPRICGRLRSTVGVKLTICFNKIGENGNTELRAPGPSDIRGNGCRYAFHDKLAASFGIFSRLVGNRNPATAAIVFEVETEAIAYAPNWFYSRIHPASPLPLAAVSPECGPFDDSGGFNACGRRSDSTDSASMLTNDKSTGDTRKKPSGGRLVPRTDEERKALTELARRWTLLIDELISGTNHQHCDGRCSADGMDSSLLR
jgi:hypothetical protein